MESALIEAVEKRRCLFDKAEPNYYKRTYVSSEWKKVAKEVGCNGDNFILFIFCLCLPVCLSVCLYACLSIGLLYIIVILYPNEKEAKLTLFKRDCGLIRRYSICCFAMAMLPAVMKNVP